MELWFELWFELEFELWFELELLLQFQLELLLRFELVVARPRSFRDWRLMVRRLDTARARHHSIGLPSIFRPTTRTCVDAGLESLGASAAVRAAFR